MKYFTAPGNASNEIMLCLKDRDYDNNSTCTIDICNTLIRIY